MVWLVFAGLVAACAVTGALFEPGAWYAGLDKPTGTPPEWVFGPVWTALYVMIAIAGALLWRAPPSSARTWAVALWTVQLILNGTWSWLCFGRNELGWSLLDIVALLAVITALVAMARRVRVAAAWLLLPYLLWVAYATYLNWGLWHLNPS